MRFVMVDRIVSLEPGQSIEAVKTLPADEELFLDHFPGFPVVPGVLLTEMMAQAAGKCLHAEPDREGRAMLGKILSARFHDWVRPGEEVRIEARIVQSRSAFARAECTAAVGDTQAASADLFFVFVPADTFAPDYRDEVLAAFLGEGSDDPVKAAES